ncbi:unnamed protein product [Didymodactylos carnosus]|uniref:HTH psq-type domain-containing protein n=1 Tax=Didymodactylos carnosus TaxID=1234261 RepID=A0A8S2UHT3_9BILA|nr:unnamed protein product [Didymodactylos carnosus]CAF4345223.1 unnamed protein product [Didymodactylos carnosus]
MPRTYVKKGQGSRYSNDDFQAALKEISEVSTIHAAAKKYKIPYSTLQLHSNSPPTHRYAGRPTRFTDLEETFLVGAATVLQEWGAPITSAELIKMATCFGEDLRKTFLRGKPTREWYSSFMVRHPELKPVKPIPLQLPRSKITMSIIDKWFTLLEQVLNDNDLIDKPSQIFNCDESGFCDRTDIRKVIIASPTKFPYKKQAGTGGK